MRTTRLQRVGLLDLLAALFFVPLNFTGATLPPHIGYGFNRGADPHTQSCQRHACAGVIADHGRDLDERHKAHRHVHRRVSHVWPNVRPLLTTS